MIDLSTWQFLFLAIIIIHGGFKVYLYTRNLRLWNGLSQRGELRGDYAPPGYDFLREYVYRSSLAWIEIFAIVTHTGILYSLLKGGLFAKAVMLASTFGDIAASALLGALGVAFLAITDIPWDAFKTFRIERRFGFSKISVLRYIWEQFLKLCLYSALSGAIFAILAFFIVNFKFWPLWAFIGLAAFTLLLAFAAPLFLSCIYRLKPLEDEILISKLVSVMEGGGLKLSGIFIADESNRSTHLNAAVIGIGNTKKIILFDTLLKNLTLEETQSVISHEVGHIAMKHMQKRLTCALLNYALLLTPLAFLMNFPLNLFGLSGQFAGKLALSLMISSLLVGLIFEPFMSHMSRKHELEADAYAHMRSGNMIWALKKLGTKEMSWLPCDKLYAAINLSHPTLAERLAALEKIEKTEKI